MVKKLIGLTAVLSLTLLATAATAAGPRPARLDRVDQVARPTVGAVEHFQRTSTRPTTHAARTEPRMQHVARPAKLQRQLVRTDIVVGSTSRTASGAVVMSSEQHAAMRNPLQSRMAQRARCEDSAACGAHSSPADTTRMSSPNAQRDGVSEMRRHMRNERLYRMIMGKIMMKMHPGK